MSQLANQVLDHERNALIHFNKDDHEYFYSGDTPAIRYSGITSLIGEYQDDFDAEEVAKWVARRDNKTQEQVLEEWSAKGQRALDLGDHTHDTIEYYVNDGTVGDEEIINLHDQAIEEMGLEPICCEWVVYDERIPRASAIDGVYKWQHKDELVLVDYKTNENWPVKYWKDHGDNFHYPIQHLPDAKYYQYALQLNFYRKWVMDQYELPVSDKLLILHIRDGEYEWIPVLNYQQEIEMLYERENVISS